MLQGLEALELLGFMALAFRGLVVFGFGDC